MLNFTHVKELTFFPLVRENLKEIRHFSALPFAKQFNLSSETIEARWLDEIIETLSLPGAIGIAAKSEGSIRGFVIIAPLPWDSNVIGKRMSAIKYLSADPMFSQRAVILEKLLQNTVEYATQESIDFLLFKTEGTDWDLNDLLIKQGFERRDILLNYVYEFNGKQPKNQFSLPDGFSIRLAERSDSQNLVEIARASFSSHFGRFHTDPYIGCEKAAKIYEEWIKSCLNGWADWTLLVIHGKRIVGYCSWQKPLSYDIHHNIFLGSFSIMGIHPDYFRRGLATCLTSEGMNLLKDKVNYISAFTHVDNFPVQRAFQKLGWQIIAEQHSYHKWINI